ncbi:MAG: AAA family ATPase [Methanothrix sp.]|nr:AAA family ATPase [Methanothrix sp.]
MRVKTICVSKLFGIFNHKIPLNMEERITIIHGPNGFGKTIMLKMIEAIFDKNYKRLKDIPFSEFFLDFDDNSQLILRKNSSHINDDSTEDITATGRNSEEKLILEYKRPNLESESYEVKGIRFDPRMPLSIIQHEIPFLSRVGPKEWRDVRSNEILNLEDVIGRYSDRLHLPARYLKDRSEPLWLDEIRSSIKVYFIDTQRLYSADMDYDDSGTLQLAVSAYSKELASTIQFNLAKYAETSQSLDRTFPLRLVKTTESTSISTEDLLRKLNDLEKKRSDLEITGLLDKKPELDFKELFEKIDDSNKNVLSVYIKDVGDKLKVLDEISTKIDLFRRIINERFLYKKMHIDKKDGFVFKTKTGDAVSPSQLSSGEQHELVMLFELLFKVGSNSLILIDEPELSLHIIWQRQFLRDLQEIAKLTEYDVLIATHSPQIIHDRYDLAIELTGPEDA